MRLQPHFRKPHSRTGRRDMGLRSQIDADPCFSCSDDRLGPGGYLQLAEDVGDVILYGFLTQEELFTDLCIAQPCRDQLQNFIFTLREA